MNSRIIVVVSGGVVTDVYSSNAEDEVDVLDYDNLKSAYGTSDPDLYQTIVKEAEKEIEELVSVY